MVGKIVLALTICTMLSCSKNTSETSGTPPNNPPPVSNNPAPKPDPNAQTPASADVELKGFGVVREFGGADTAAIFGLRPSSGSLVIKSVNGPRFLGTARVGTLDQTAIDHLFLKSSIPMSQQEKQSLVAQWSGAQVIYFEGYSGAFCSSNETQSEVTASGALNGKPFVTTFQFIALPSSTGDCTYHTFGIITRN